MDGVIEVENNSKKTCGIIKEIAEATRVEPFKYVSKIHEILDMGTPRKTLTVGG